MSLHDAVLSKHSYSQSGKDSIFKFIFISIFFLYIIKIILCFARKRELLEILKKHDIENYITMKICKEYIDGKIEDKVYEVKDKIRIGIFSL